MSLYAVVRNDLGMSPGKCASQAGHAYLGAFLTAQPVCPEVTAAYAADLPGTKVCLQGSMVAITRAQDELKAAGIPCFLVVDSGCLNFFDGKPTVTALGFGPIAQGSVPKFLSKLQLY